MTKFKAWIEAMRLRTLPVSIAGVLAGTACAVYFHSFRAAPAVICLLFALLAQIASNFANEYYDFKNGFDKKGREGFRRGVTEGDLSPNAMLRATYGVLFIDCCLGLSLVYWGGWWLLPIGVAIALFAIGYSTGPYPLSHHGLGDIAVFIFFGLVPVWLTAWLQTGLSPMWPETPCVAAAIGLMGVNVLIVNNYRDADDDAKVGKRTTVVRFGRFTMAGVYLADVIVATLLSSVFFIRCGRWSLFFPILYLCVGIRLWTRLRSLRGNALNAILKFTSLSMFIISIGLVLAALL